MSTETDLGREVRAAVAAALKRFGENDIAAIRVNDLRKIDALINPIPDGFEIPTARTDAVAYEVMSERRIERLRFEVGA